MPKCLLFDFFGTLVEYKPDRADHTFPLTHQLVAEQVDAIAYDDLIARIETSFAHCETQATKDGREFLMQEVADHLATALSIEVDLFVDTYMSEWRAEISAVPGVQGMLRRLSKHYDLGLISNTHHSATVYALLEQFELAGLFKAIELSADFGLAKPAPEIFLSALDRMQTQPESATYIGDSYAHDYVGARAVGMSAMLIGRHARVPKEHLLRSILDLPIHFNVDR